MRVIGLPSVTEGVLEEVKELLFTSKQLAPPHTHIKVNYGANIIYPLRLLRMLSYAYSQAEIPKLRDTTLSSCSTRCKVCIQPDDPTFLYSGHQSHEIGYQALLFSACNIDELGGAWG